jgi:hypothetical protein
MFGAGNDDFTYCDVLFRFSGMDLCTWGRGRGVVFLQNTAAHFVKSHNPSHYQGWINTNILSSYYIWLNVFLVDF